jgi:hypothetical protein
MERLLCEPDLAMRMGRRSREMAEERFDVHGVNLVLLHNMGPIPQEAESPPVDQ